MSDGGDIPFRKPFGAYDYPYTYNQERPAYSRQDTVPIDRSTLPIAATIPANAQVPAINPSVQPVEQSSALSKVLNWTGKNVAPAIKAASPFASNIINSLRKPPMPITPTYNSPVTLSGVNMDNERARVSREINAGSAAADRTVDGNTAAAIKRFDQGTKLDRYSQIAEQENNTNAGIRNQQAQINAGIQAGNNQKLDNYHDQLTDRQIAQQREQSMNLANAGEKLTGIQNETEKRRVDLAKTQVLSTIFDKSGVLNRQRLKWKKLGIEDPLGQDYKGLEEKKFGGTLKANRFKRMRPLQPLKQIPQNTEV